MRVGWGEGVRANQETNYYTRKPCQNIPEIIIALIYTNQNNYKNGKYNRKYDFENCNQSYYTVLGKYLIKAGLRVFASLGKCNLRCPYSIVKLFGW